MKKLVNILYLLCLLHFPQDAFSASADLKLSEIMEKALVETRSLKVQQLNLQAAQIEKLAPVLDPLSVNIGGSQSIDQSQHSSGSQHFSNQNTFRSQNFSVSYTFSPVILARLEANNLNIKAQESVIKAARSQILITAATQYFVYQNTKARINFLNCLIRALGEIQGKSSLNAESKSLITSKIASLQFEVQSQINAQEIALNELSRYVGMNVINEVRKSQATSQHGPALRDRSSLSRSNTETMEAEIFNKIQQSIPLIEMSEAQRLSQTNPAIIQAQIAERQIRISGLIQVLSATGPKITLSFNSTRSQDHDNRDQTSSRTTSQSAMISYSMSISGAIGLNMAANRMRDRAAQINVDAKIEDIQINLANLYINENSYKSQVEQLLSALFDLSTSFEKTPSVSSSNISEIVQRLDALATMQNQLANATNRFYINRLNIHGITGTLESLIPYIRNYEAKSRQIGRE